MLLNLFQLPYDTKKVDILTLRIKNDEVDNLFDTHFNDCLTMQKMSYIGVITFSGKWNNY